jgi:hypothetical protein
MTPLANSPVFNHANLHEAYKQADIRLKGANRDKNGDESDVLCRNRKIDGR